MDLNGTTPRNSSQLPIAVDAMGADRGLGVVVEGAVSACREFGISTILVGDKAGIDAKLQGLGAVGLPLEVVHAPDVITMDESPSKAVRRKPNSSLCVAYNLVQGSKASAIISAGNSGAMMAAGRLICGNLPGIERPAIATLIPVVGDGIPNVILDTGANVDCHAQNLVQFAIMGSIYCSTLLGVKSPRVALLSNGSESSKGNDVVRAAAVALSALESLNFIGYVEGRDIPVKSADVVVCDGFVGNVVLKSLEGCVRMILDQILLESKKGVFRRLGMVLCRGLFREVFGEKFDYTAYGGAPLLGLKKLGVVLHGSSDVRAVKNAIRVAQAFAEKRMVENISVELAKLEEVTLDLASYQVGSGLFGPKRGVSTQSDGGSQRVVDRVTDRGGAGGSKAFVEPEEG